MEDDDEDEGQDVQLGGGAFLARLLGDGTIRDDDDWVDWFTEGQLNDLYNQEFTCEALFVWVRALFCAERGPAENKALVRPLFMLPFYLLPSQQWEAIASGEQFKRAFFAGSKNPHKISLGTELAQWTMRPLKVREGG